MPRGPCARLRTPAGRPAPGVVVGHCALAEALARHVVGQLLAHRVHHVHGAGGQEVAIAEPALTAAAAAGFVRAPLVRGIQQSQLKQSTFTGSWFVAGDECGGMRYDKNTGK